VMRGIWESTVEKPFSYEGTFFCVENAFLSLKPFTKPNPRIYLGAMGPIMRDAVAQIADGWIPIHYTPETYEKDWRDMQRAVERAGREPGGIDPGLILFTTVLRDGERAGQIASLMGRKRLLGRPQLLSALGLSELADDNQSIAKRPDLSWLKRTELLNAIPEELARRITISGTPEEAIEQIEGFVKAGVRLFAVYPPFDDEHASVETLENYKNTVLPYFAKKER